MNGERKNVLKKMVFLLIIILLLNVSLLLPQEKLKLYIINEKLGKLIDLKERNLLGLYSEVNDFRYAAFFTGENNSFGVKTLYYDKNEIKFMVKNYTGDEIEMISRYIEEKLSGISMQPTRAAVPTVSKLGLLVDMGEKVDFEGNGIGYGVNLGIVGGDYFSINGGYSRITFEGKNKANIGLSFRTSFFPEEGDEESFVGIGARYNRTFEKSSNPGEDIDSGELFLDFGCNIKISEKQIFYIKLSPSMEYILKDDIEDKTSGGVFVTLGFLFH